MCLLSSSRFVLRSAIFGAALRDQFSEEREKEGERWRDFSLLLYLSIMSFPEYSPPNIPLSLSLSLVQSFYRIGREMV